MQVKMNGYVMNPSWLYCTCCMPPLPVNGGFVRMCKRGTLQFVFLKPILAVITIVLFTQGKYTEGFWGPSNGYAALAPGHLSTHISAGGPISSKGSTRHRRGGNKGKCKLLGIGMQDLC